MMYARQKSLVERTEPLDDEIFQLRKRAFLSRPKSPQYHTCQYRNTTFFLVLNPPHHSEQSPQLVNITTVPNKSIVEIFDLVETNVYVGSINVGPGTGESRRAKHFREC